LFKIQNKHKMSHTIKLQPDRNEISTELIFLNVGTIISELAKKKRRVKAMKKRMEELLGGTWRGGNQYEKINVHSNGKMKLFERCFTCNPKEITFDGVILGMITGDGKFISNDEASALIQENNQGFKDVPFLNLGLEQEFNSGEEEISFIAKLMHKQDTTIFLLDIPGFGKNVEQVLVGASNINCAF